MRRTRRTLRAAALLAGWLLPWSSSGFAKEGAPRETDLTTAAERSGYEVTGRYAEVLALSTAFERAFPGKVRARTFGTSPEGRPMVALVASADGTFEPSEARRKGRPVILVQGGIHAGEIDGKDAGFAVLRDALAGRVAAGALAKATLVFVPVFNVDGHERFGPSQRPNQRGPREGGWRTTAQNLNLNRDYVKAEAPEMQAMLRLLGEYDPVAYVDLHVTDGAKFRHDIAVLVDPAETADLPLQPVARSLRASLLSRLTRAGHLPLPFYPSFRRDDDPASGFAVGTASPRLSNPYWASRGRLGVLVETHSWHSYRERVLATRNVLIGLLELVAEGNAAGWGEAIRRADEEALSLGGKEIVVDWRAGEASETIEFLGYAYERFPSPVSGRLSIRYDETRPEVWSVPLFTPAAPARTVRAPRGGYVVPPAHAEWVRVKLALHGIRVLPVEKAKSGVEAESFRAAEAKFSERPYEGRTTVKVRGAWTTGVHDLPAGSLYVPVAQPGGRLAVHMLEPEAPDSLVSWGFFSAVFERKEYMESYVAEEVAADMLRDDAVRGEFEKRLAEDPGFAADPAARRLFFEQRHPSWDGRKDLYPVLRVAQDPGR